LIRGGRADPRQSRANLLLTRDEIGATSTNSNGGAFERGDAGPAAAFRAPLARPPFSLPGRQNHEFLV
jgi:hypothetical protein